MSKNKSIYKKEIIKIILPALLTVMLFVAALFWLILPVMEKNLTNQKKKMITAVAQTAIDILAYYEKQSRSGVLSLAEAQESAIKQIRNLHYGQDNKDYFWINDMQPKMVMHPYRPDLEGQDISAYADPDGKRLFMEMVAVVKQEGSGYVRYRWQWKDDQTRIVPKISYVELFRPWGWILGTGVYLEDIRGEMTIIRNDILSISAVILFVISLLSLYITRKTVKEMSMRRIAEEELNAYKDQLEEKVERRTRELKEALSSIKVLRGFLPICASCKKIRDDNGYWNQIESYIRSHSYAEFSHSICPDCAKKMYPELENAEDVTKK